jgi:sirohydrochlorin ferrochelatase
MYAFARLREQAAGLRTEVAFLAMARPMLHEQLAALGDSAARRVIVQPHLLFHGELVESLQQQVNQAARDFPQTDWMMTSTLADEAGIASVGCELLVRVVTDRLEEAGIRVVAVAVAD